MAFEKYSTAQLKKASKILLIIGVIALGVTCFALGIGIYQTTKNEDSSLLFLVPTVFGPLAIFPSILASILGGEIKRRQNQNPN